MLLFYSINEDFFPFFLPSILLNIFSYFPIFFISSYPQIHREYIFLYYVCINCLLYYTYKIIFNITI